MRQTKADILSRVTKEFTVAKIIAPNTLQIEYVDGSTAIRFHNTDIVTKLPNGKTILTSGGWMTSPTKDRLSRFGPVSISQVKGQWYLGSTITFYDGIILDKFNNPIRPRQVNLNKIDKQLKQINKFVSQLKKDNLPVPSSGDCWLCSIRDADGKTMGELRGSGNDDHITLHVKENYVHGSLLVNAMREYGFADSQIRLHYSMGLVGTFKRALRKYLKKHIIKNIAV
jgi:hypothetical protein